MNSYEIHCQWNNYHVQKSCNSQLDPFHLDTTLMQYCRHTKHKSWEGPVSPPSERYGKCFADSTRRTEVAGPSPWCLDNVGKSISADGYSRRHAVISGDSAVASSTCRALNYTHERSGLDGGVREDDASASLCDCHGLGWAFPPIRAPFTFPLSVSLPLRSRHAFVGKWKSTKLLNTR